MKISYAIPRDVARGQANDYKTANKTTAQSHERAARTKAFNLQINIAHVLRRADMTPTGSEFDLLTRGATRLTRVAFLSPDTRKGIL